MRVTKYVRGDVKLDCQWKYFIYRLHSGNEKKKYIGKFFEGKKIVDCLILQAKGYIWNGLALLLSDGYWAFGCPVDYITNSPEPQETK